MSFGRVSVLSLSLTLCVVLLAALVPVAAVAAPEGKTREYIVTLSVKDSGRSIKPANRSAKQRIRQRAKAASEATDRVTKRHGVKSRYRYGNAVTGFSARMTAVEARTLAADPEVSNVRVARKFKVAATEIVPHGIRRVKAWTSGTTPGPDVNANVAVIDTGIGPANGDGDPVYTVPTGPGYELNIAGGVNCYDAPGTSQNEAFDKDNPKVSDGWYGDTQGHGTHVAGIIGARDNDTGTIGVAPGVNLYSVRVFGPSGGGSEAGVVCGLDWVIGTHLYGYAPKIDVVNMSIQGNRLDYQENCTAIISDSGADPMQQSVCELTQMHDVPVVASAGNYAIDVNESAPGGYDQVISVAAMTDTDGVGWEAGPNAGCGYGSDRDDTFASYSNHGRDIDIVAPGTCVYSTSHNNPNGGAVPLTGTSMAAPHVTGAIARYVDEVGNPDSVMQMRQLIRAAGRMDWDSRTDPVWDGVNDIDPPNRVLDVAALTGAPALKAFVYHEAFKVGGTSTSRTSRVDVQRSGGYGSHDEDAAVSLSVEGLPGGAGSVSFDDASLNGLGRNNLGTNVNFTLNGSGGEGVHDITIRASSGGLTHGRGLELTIDRTAPTISGLSPRVRGSKVAMTAKGKAQVYLQWTATDALSEVKSAQLQRKIGTGAWKNAGVGGTSSSRVWLKRGQNNKFRVKATDSVGNVKTSAAVGARLSVRDSTSSQWIKSGQWKTKKVQKAFGGSILLSTGGTSTLSTTFTGKAAAIAASIGPARGTFRVRVDGGDWQNVNTKTSYGGHRKVVWTTRLPYGTHAVEIERLSGQAAIDALLIVR